MEGKSLSFQVDDENQVTVTLSNTARISLSDITAATIGDLQEAGQWEDNSAHATESGVTVLRPWEKNSNSLKSPESTQNILDVQPPSGFHEQLKRRLDDDSPNDKEDSKRQKHSDPHDLKIHQDKSAQPNDVRTVTNQETPKLQHHYSALKSLQEVKDDGQKSAKNSRTSIQLVTSTSTSEKQCFDYNLLQQALQYYSGLQSLAKNPAQQSSTENPAQQTSAFKLGQPSSAFNPGQQSSAFNPGQQSSVFNYVQQSSSAYNFGQQSLALNQGQQKSAFNCVQQNFTYNQGQQTLPYNPVQQSSTCTSGVQISNIPLQQTSNSSSGQQISIYNPVQQTLNYQTTGQQSSNQTQANQATSHDAVSKQNTTHNLRQQTFNNNSLQQTAFQYPDQQTPIKQQTPQTTSSTDMQQTNATTMQQTLNQFSAPSTNTYSSYLPWNMLSAVDNSETGNRLPEMAPNQVTSHNTPQRNAQIPQHRPHHQMPTNQRLTNVFAYKPVTWGDSNLNQQPNQKTFQFPQTGSSAIQMSDILQTANNDGQSRPSNQAWGNVPLNNVIVVKSDPELKLEPSTPIGKTLMTMSNYDSPGMDSRFTESLSNLLGSPPPDSPLSKNPFLGDLQTLLNSECKREIVPQTLFGMQNKQPATDKPRKNVFERERNLQERFTTLQTSHAEDVRQLSSMFRYQSALIETERFRTLHESQFPGTYRDSINHHYDNQLHNVMDRVERSVELLETSNKENRASKAPKVRPHLSKESIRLMESWYQQNVDHPYPTNSVIEMLAQAGNIGVEQVKKWFANKRNRNSNTRSLTEIAMKKRKLGHISSQS